MFKLTKKEIIDKADKLSFNKPPLEKVLRLVEILNFLNSDSTTKRKLALKGGTAINFSVLPLPRLSVDIDLDYCKICNRNEMLEERNVITEKIQQFCLKNNYIINKKMSKRYHSLDSFILDYISCFNSKDRIKIEINYSMRNHIFKEKEVKFNAKEIFTENSILVLNPIELYAAKINALLDRRTPRDLYDVNNMFKFNIFDKNEINMLKKSFVIYTALSKEKIPENYQLENIDEITLRSTMQYLKPLINTKEHIPLEEMKENVKTNLIPIVTLEPNEKKFLTLFDKGIYKPELLFTDKEIIERIKHHPMAEWKMQNKLSSLLKEMGLSSNDTKKPNVNHKPNDDWDMN